MIYCVALSFPPLFAARRAYKYTKRAYTYTRALYKLVNLYYFRFKCVTFTIYLYTFILL